MASIEKRTNEKGKLTYRAKVRLKGCPSQSATFERLTDARHWIQETETYIRQGRYFKTSESKRQTLAKLIDRYIAAYLSNGSRNSEGRKQQLMWWRSELGSFVLSDITPALISEKKETLSLGKIQGNKSRSNASVNRYLAALSHIFTVSTNEWGWTDANPLSKVKKLKEPRGRVRFLSDEERERLLDACQNSEARSLYLIVMLALSTGMRRGEVLGLTWDDIDLQRGRITLRKTKNGEIRVVPIGAKTLGLLKTYSNIRGLDTDLLFPGINPLFPVNCRPAWNSALKKAGIQDFKFHDLRHSTASYLVMNGASLAEIAEVLGHKTLAMVKRYAHMSDSHVANVIEKMNQKIFG